MKSSPLFDWNYYPAKFADVDDTKKIIVVNQGGTSSGKTYTIMQVLFKMAIHNRDWIITVVGQDVPNLKKGPIRDSRIIVSKDEFIDSNIISYNKSDKIYTFKSGSIIEFTSYDDAQDAQNGKRHVLFVNEANGITYAIYNQLNMRTSQRTFLDYNPTSRFWVHNKVLGKPNVVRFISNYQHNPFLDNNIRLEIEGLKDDEQLWRVYGMGLTGKIKDLVFNTAITDYWPEYLDKHGFGLDFGFSNDPTTLIECGLSDGKLYGRQIIYQKGLTNNDIHKLLLDAGISKAKQIFADAADPKSIDELKSYGWNIKAADKGRDSIRAGINLIKEYGTVHIHKKSRKFIEEAETYKYKVDKKTGETINEPVDAFNHCWDAFRYWAIMKLSRKGKNTTLAYG